MSITDQREQAVLRYIGYNAHPRRDVAVTLGHGQAAIRRLTRAGLVKADEEYSGCLVLTEAGVRHLAFIDGEQDYEGRDTCSTS